MPKIILLSILLLTHLDGSMVFGENIFKKGRVTGLDIPRFVSLKNKKTFVRRGPGKSYRIDWILEKSRLPLKIIGEHNHWRQVEDFQGDTGWIYFRLLSGKRTVITTHEKILLRKKKGDKAKPIAVLNSGVVGELIKSTNESCQARFQDYKGWVDKGGVWGC